MMKFTCPHTIHGMCTAIRSIHGLAGFLSPVSGGADLALISDSVLESVLTSDSAGDGTAGDSIGIIEDSTMAEGHIFRKAPHFLTVTTITTAILGSVTDIQ